MTTPLESSSTKVSISQGATSVNKTIQRTFISDVRQWFATMSKSWINTMSIMTLGFLGVGLLTTGVKQESSKLTALGGMTYIINFGFSACQGMHPSPPRQEMLKANIQELIEKFPESQNNK